MKLLFTCCVAFLSMLNICAQSNENFFNWAFNTGGGFNYVNQVGYDYQGNFIAVGGFNDIGTVAGVTLGNANTSLLPAHYLVKRDVSGNYSLISSYVKVAGTPGVSYSHFCIDNNNNIFLAGFIENAQGQSVNFNNGISLNTDGCFIVKFNPNGQAQWAQSINFGLSNPGSVHVIALSANADDNIMFAGRADGGSKPFWIVKFDQSGTELFHNEHTFSNTNFALVPSINHLNFDQNGNSFFYGMLLSSPTLIIDGVDTVNCPAGTTSFCAYLLNFDGQGNKKYYAGYNGSFKDLAVHNITGNVFINWINFGSNPPPLDTLPLQFGAYTGVVLIDANNNFLGASQFNLFNPLDPSKATCLLPVEAQRYIYAAEIKVNTATTINCGNQSYTMTAGKRGFYVESDDSLNNKEFVSAPGLLATPNGGYDLSSILGYGGSKIAVAGLWDKQVNTNLTINGNVLSACFADGNFATRYPNYADLMYDNFLTEYNRPSLVGINAISDAKIMKIVPNPNNGTFKIAGPDFSSEAIVTIHNYLGQRRYQGTLANGEISTILSKGIYTLTIFYDNKTSYQKLLVN